MANSSKKKPDKSDGTEKVISSKSVPSPVKVYSDNIGRKRAPSLVWEPPEWDLAECSRIANTESYVRRAFAAKEALFKKEGYRFVSKTPQRASYIKERMKQMERAGGMPFDLLMSKTIGSLVWLNNAFWVKKRDYRASGGKKRKKGGRTLSPVAAYFFLPAETVRFKRDEYGKVKKYQQKIGYKEPVEFPPEDVVHFYFDRQEGFSVGTPKIVPVKDDIRALRRIEENVELLVYQHLFPTFHYQVGTENAPARTLPDGRDEVEVVRQELEQMPSDGCWVTPERHEIDVLGAEGEALKVENVIKHFKERIFTGLGVSPVDMGESGTSNRSTAQTLSMNLINQIKAEQGEFAQFLNAYVINDLLEESTFPEGSLFDEGNRVSVEFKEIDQERRVALENHLSQMYLQHYYTHDQMRIAGGEEPWTEEDWDSSYWEQMDKPIKLMQSLDEPYCQSKDTEILTASGWRLFKDLDEYDKVATLRDGKDLVYEKPIERLEFDYDGKMYLLQSRFVDVCVTPNHRLYICKYNQGHYKTKHEFGLQRADEVFGEYKKFKRSACWTGEEKEISSISYKTEDWLEFLGWYISEGYIDNEESSGFRIGVCQDIEANPDNCQQIENLLDRLELNYRYDGKQFTFNDPRIFSHLKNSCPGYSYEKHIPSYVRLLSPRLIKIFLGSLMAGDGETKYHYLYSTASKKLADDVQELALKAGYGANIRVEHRDEDQRDIYRVGISRDKYCDVADRMKYGPQADSLVEEWVDYKDKVYSVRTTSGVIYVRRNGKARWCGNSPESKAVAMANVNAAKNSPSNSGGSSKKPQATKTRSSSLSKNKAGENKNKPKNQHGERKSTKLNKDIFFDAPSDNPVIFAETSVGPLLRQKLPIQEAYRDLRATILRKIKRDGWEEKAISAVAGMVFEEAKDKLVAKAKRAYRFGIEDAGLDVIEVLPNSRDGEIAQHIIYHCDKLRSEVMTHFGDNLVKSKYLNNENTTLARLVLDALSVRSGVIDESEIMRAYNAGLADSYRRKGAEIIDISPTSAQPCEICKQSSLRWTRADAILYEELPPLHPWCSCLVRGR